MPRIDVVKLRGWWRLNRYVAFNVSDFGEYRYVRLGVTARHATGRTLWALTKDEK